MKCATQQQLLLNQKLLVSKEMSREKCFSHWNPASQVVHTVFMKHEFLSSDKTFPPINYLHLQMRKQRQIGYVTQRLSVTALEIIQTCHNVNHTDLSVIWNQDLLSPWIFVSGIVFWLWNTPIFPIVFLFPWFLLVSTPYTATFGFNLQDLFTRASLRSLSI